MGEPGAGRQPEPELRGGVIDPDRGVHQGDDGLTAGGLRPGDDVGQDRAIVPVIELEPEWQARGGCRDLLDAGRGVDGHDKQAASPGGAGGHRQFALGVDRALETHRPDHHRGRNRGTQHGRGGRDRRDIDEHARPYPAASEGGLVVALERVAGARLDPAVGRAVKKVTSDLPIGLGGQTGDERIGHRGVDRKRMEDLVHVWTGGPG